MRFYTTKTQSRHGNVPSPPLFGRLQDRRDILLYKVEVSCCEFMQLKVSQVDDVVGVGDDDRIVAELKAVAVDEILERLRRHIDIGVAEERMVELEHIMVRRGCIEIVDNRQPKIGPELESIRYCGITGLKRPVGDLYFDGLGILQAAVGRCDGDLTVMPIPRLSFE